MERQRPPVARSILFVPATRPERIAKALASGADAVVVDLEDAIAPSDKVAAREALIAALDPARPVMVRINGVESEWFEQDMAACGHPGIAGIMLPKVETAASVQAVHNRRHLPVTALIETARGVWNALEIAQAPGAQRLAFGALDFRLDLGLPDAGHEQLAVYRSRLVLASRVALLAPPIDAPTPSFTDLAQVRAESEAARRLGFGGKLCVHPDQVAIVNESFLPSVVEVEWARKVVAAARAAGGAAVAVDGRMVDRPVIDLAERILAQSRVN